MNRDSSDWKSKAEEFLSDLLQNNGDQDNNGSAIDKSIDKAFELLDLIENDSSFLIIEDLLSSIFDVLRHHLSTGCNDGDSTGSDRDDQEPYKSNSYLDPIVNILESQLLTPSLKINLIQFMNLILSKFTIDENDNFDNSKTIYEVLLHKDLNNNEVDETIYNNMQSIKSSLDPFWRRIVYLIGKEHEQSIRNLSKNSSSCRDTSDAETIKLYGDYVSEKIYGGSRFLSTSLSNAVPFLTKSIENIGTLAKQNIEPHESETLNTNNHKEEDLNVKITNATLEATDVFRESAKAVAFGLRNYCTQGINNVVEKWEEHEIGKELCPEPELREAFVFGGKISMATLGSAVHLAESMFEATKTGKAF